MLNIDGLKIPGHLKQNLLDTSSKKGWLNTLIWKTLKFQWLALITSSMTYLKATVTKYESRAIFVASRFGNKTEIQKVGILLSIC